MENTLIKVRGSDAANAAECELLNGIFATFVQILLGLIAVSVLLLKRQRESPQRPLQIWALDASKQLIGAGFAHVTNLAIAILLYKYDHARTHRGKEADQCALYFMNFTMDTTFGVFLNYLFLRLLSSLSNRFGWTSMKTSGDYGDPIEIKRWTIQLISWISVILAVKVVIASMLFCVNEQLETFTYWLFQPLRRYPKVELLLVMIACPCIMNGFQFWIQDSFLKNDIHNGSQIASTKSPKELKKYPQSEIHSAISVFCRKGNTSNDDEDQAIDPLHNVAKV
ncbi:unnamed protein product [Albugo candida]|uniref:Uncharacterized protein n=1 Tax=Albugo candida TaxID=65357 RepID=A0A024G6F9_9STRA|nr:unnamed protein product [Albugo candida]|eukprot:CCI42426.1 unnamed protein product [Albugo candida]